MFWRAVRGVVTFLGHIRGRVTVFWQEIGGGNKKIHLGKKLHQLSSPVINGSCLMLQINAPLVQKKRFN